LLPENGTIKGCNFYDLFKAAEYAPLTDYDIPANLINPMFLAWKFVQLSGSCSFCK
jgi:hypothetical protein